MAEYVTHNVPQISIAERSAESMCHNRESQPQSERVACERWFAVKSQPKREMRAFIHLGNQGFRVFMPKGKKTIRHARKISTVVTPFFPGYLFLALDLTRDRWRSVNGTFGVHHIITAQGQPQAVPQGIVEAMMEATDAEGFLAIHEDLPKVGASVRLLAGPFAEKLGQLDRLDGSGRVRVLLEMMGCSIPVRTHLNQICAA